MNVLSIDKSSIPIQQDVLVRAIAGEKPAVSGTNTTVQDQPKKTEEFTQRLEEAVKQLDRTVETYNTDLKFTIHKESGRVSVKVIDTRDDSVIREIPPERVLEFAAYVKKMLGILLDKLI